MDADTRKEIKLRTVRLGSQDAVKSSLDGLEARLMRLYSRKHETVDGKRVKLTKRRKIALANKMIDKAIDSPDITQDAINQLKVLDD